MRGLGLLAVAALLASPAVASDWPKGLAFHAAVEADVLNGAPSPAGFRPLSGGANRPLLVDPHPMISGGEIRCLGSSRNIDGGPAYAGEFNERGAATFSAYTADHIGQPFAIVLDGKVIMAPVINSEITGNGFQIFFGDAPSPELSAWVAASGLRACVPPTEAETEAARAATLERVLKGVREGDNESVAMLNLLISAHEISPRDDAELIGWLQQAADAGSSHAKGVLGVMYARGVAGSVPADPNRAFNLLSQSVAQGDLSGALDLARLYDRGLGVPKDPAKTAALYRQLADTGVGNAMYLLAFAYFKGEGVAPDPVEGMRWLRLAIDPATHWFRDPSGERRDAVSSMGDVYAFDGWVARDMGQAIQWYEQAARLGDSHAMVELSRIHHDGDGVPVDHGKAFTWAKQASDAGDPEGQARLGWLYANGEGVALDLPAAMVLYRKAAEAGEPTAMYNLAYGYLRARGLERNDAEGMRWLKAASDAGDDESTMALGYEYWSGEHVPQDRVAAFRTYKQAADRDLPEAVDTIGNLYQRGEGVAADPVEAVKWYRKAIALDDAGGMFDLGDAYENGLGIGKDLEAAVGLYTRAAKYGQADAIAALKRLGRPIPPHPNPASG